MISTIKKSKNTFTLAIIIWFHRPVLSYNKRQSRTGQMCNHMIFIEFVVETNLAPQRSVYIIVQSIYEKPGTNCKINLKNIYIKSSLLSLYTHV